MTSSGRRSPALIEPGRYDPEFQSEMLRLHRLHVYGRWAFIVALWCVFGPISLLQFREEIALMQDYFTWAALRYALAFNLLASLGLIICIGPTVGILLWQSRNALRGLSETEIKRLEKLVLRIREQGPSHPLWRWVHGQSS